MTKTARLYKEKILVWLLAITIVSSFILYVFFVNGAVLNVVAREELESNFADLNSKVSELEFQYISLKNSITIDYAYERGFYQVDQVAFAERMPSASLSVNTR